jgi:phosphate-selective porin OprO/OprP
MSGCRLETNPIMQRLFLLALVLLPVFMHMSGAAVQAREPEKILIQNVSLMDEDDQEADVIVNILVTDRKLEVVTQDEISTDKVSLAFDARQGYLIGRLTLGQQPSFMILDGDPRNDIQILLDTDSHARFAMQEGIIVRNRLDRARDIGKEPRQTGWFAYSPPPLSLPIGYESGSRWNLWKTKWISGIFIGTLALDSQYCGPTRMMPMNSRWATSPTT